MMAVLQSDPFFRYIWFVAFLFRGHPVTSVCRFFKSRGLTLCRLSVCRESLISYPCIRAAYLFVQQEQTVCLDINDEERGRKGVTLHWCSSLSGLIDFEKDYCWYQMSTSWQSYWFFDTTQQEIFICVLLRPRTNRWGLTSAEWQIPMPPLL